MTILEDIKGLFVKKKEIVKKPQVLNLTKLERTFLSVLTKEIDDLFKLRSLGETENSNLEQYCKKTNKVIRNNFLRIRNKFIKENLRLIRIELTKNIDDINWKNLSNTNKELKSLLKP